MITLKKEYILAHLKHLGDDDMKEVLTCFHFDTDGIVTTDGVTLLKTHFDTKLAAPVTVHSEVFINALKLMKHSKTAVNRLSTLNEIEVDFETNSIKVMGTDEQQVSFQMKRSKHEYPDYKHIMVTDKTKRVAIDYIGLSTSLLARLPNAEATIEFYGVHNSMRIKGEYEDNTAYTCLVMPLRQATVPVSQEPELSEPMKMVYYAFGWQGGTIHDIVREIERLKKLDKVPVMGSFDKGG